MEIYQGLNPHLYSSGGKSTRVAQALMNIPWKHRFKPRQGNISSLISCLAVIAGTYKHDQVLYVIRTNIAYNMIRSRRKQSRNIYRNNKCHENMIRLIATIIFQKALNYKVLEWTHSIAWLICGDARLLCGFWTMQHTVVSGIVSTKEIHVRLFFCQPLFYPLLFIVLTIYSSM